MRTEGLDKTDITIIEHLQQDGRRPFTTIAKHLGMSEAAVRQRVARLLSRNIIQIVAVSNPLDLGLIWGQVHLWTQGDHIEAVAEAVAALPQVDFVSICAGGYDINAGVVAHDREELFDVFVHHIRPIPGVTKADLVLNFKVLKDNYEWSIHEIRATKKPYARRGRRAG